MKKLLFAIAILFCLTACSSQVSSSTDNTSEDSTVVDTTAIDTTVDSIL